MRTIETKLYTASELSDDALEKAIDKYRETCEYYWADDCIDSLKDCIKHLGATLSNYSIDFYNCGHSFIQLSGLYESDDFSSKVAYVNWIEEKLLEIDTPHYVNGELHCMGECGISGLWIDGSFFIGAWKEFQSGETDLEEIIKAGFYEWLDDCQKDYEAQFEKENFIDHCEANGYEFTEDGERY